MHHAIIWAIVDFLQGIHLRAISQWVLKSKINYRYILKLLSHLPAGNELK